MKVAAFQAPLVDRGVAAGIGLIQDRVRECEAAGVDVLCCPEGILGGLADYVTRPRDIALQVANGELAEVLRPLASPTVTLIVGFTEIEGADTLFNSAAVLSGGVVAGVYRKNHPAINRSVYSAGLERPVFTIGSVTIGIVICLDSRFPDVAAAMVTQGAQVLFVPTNNGMPPSRGGPELVDQARRIDIELATTLGVPVVRADMAGRAGELVSFGSSSVVDRDGTVLSTSPSLEPALLVADIEV